MKSGEEQYEQWLQKVRTTSPVMREPEELVEQIFAKIDNKARGKKKKTLLINWILTVAASFLFVFLCYETYVYPIISQREEGETVMQSTNYLLEPKVSKDWDVWSPGMSTIKKSQRLSAVWKERQEEESRKRAFLFKFSQITQTNLIK